MIHHIVVGCRDLCNLVHCLLKIVQAEGIGDADNVGIPLLDVMDLGGCNEVSFRKTMWINAVRIDDVPQLIHHFLPHVQFVIQAQLTPFLLRHVAPAAGHKLPEPSTRRLMDLFGRHHEVDVEQINVLRLDATPVLLVAVVVQEDLHLVRHLSSRLSLFLRKRFLSLQELLPLSHEVSLLCFTDLHDFHLIMKTMSEIPRIKEAFLLSSGGVCGHRHWLKNGLLRWCWQGWALLLIFQGLLLREAPLFLCVFLLMFLQELESSVHAASATFHLKGCDGWH
mmetsp:Transcript_27938/g.45766  ORF Transcript_27938/g.45766 Transcript_27938/m.45766 type:complete len:280 (-) Transcript_27938:949-1788(-)